VISRAFLDESIRVLKKGGRLELRTDSDNYFNYSFETFMSLKNVSLEIHKNRDIEITSKYEDRWRRMDKNIYDVTMIVNEESPALTLNENFDFSGSLKTIDQILELRNKTEKLDDGFIHFERLYKAENGTIIFRIAMGSFDRPEHLYLIIGEDVKYFPNSPVRTRTNLKIHKFLNETIHG
jgi:tRNA (guanine-N7-)-methyltransferase